jgi:hypothetical protein
VQAGDADNDEIVVFNIASGVPSDNKDGGSTQMQKMTAMARNRR